MPDSNANWIVTQIITHKNAKGSEIYYLNSFKDDTILNGKLYINVYINGDIKIGGYRWDTVGQVYFLSYFYNSTNDEVLMFDFSANVGDTLIVANSWGGYIFQTLPCIVQEVGYWPCGPYQLKYLSIMYNNSFIFELDYWIEGIGSLIGGIMNSVGHDIEVNRLYCQSTNDTIFYFNPFAFFPTALNLNYIQYEQGNCSTYAGIDDFPSLPQYTVNPNPFSERFTVEGLPLGKYVIKLYDYQGRLCIDRQGFTSDGRLSVETHKLKPGLYLLSIYFKNEILWKQKILKVQ
jgi:hypothetical protein